MKTKFIVSMLAIITFWLFASYSLVYSHEMGHKVQYSYFGCDAKITAGIFSGKTEPICPEGLTKEQIYSMNIVTATHENTYLQVAFYQFVLLILISYLILDLVFFKEVKT